MKEIVGIILLFLAVAMLFIGITKAALPPAITGFGFIAIGLVFLLEKVKL
jgi:hypothetical protein